ncbi:MAG: GntR family transcriptional regulator [Terricaulis sp.]
MRTIEPDSDEGLNSAIYAELRARLVTGRMAPGHELSTRSLAQELGVSQTPVRDALSRLAADGALEIRAKRRVRVPAMTPERFDDLLRCRLLLEPEAAARALPFIDVARLEKLREVDAAIDAAIVAHDADGYMTNNHAFHFTLYRAQDGRTMTQLIDTLWLQFGPFMRLVYTQLPTKIVNDRHQEAIAAVVAKDAGALRAAIAADISEGMDLVGKTGLSESD